MAAQRGYDMREIASRIGYARPVARGDIREMWGTNGIDDSRPAIRTLARAALRAMGHRLADIPWCDSDETRDRCEAVLVDYAMWVGVAVVDRAGNRVA